MPFGVDRVSGRSGADAKRRPLAGADDSLERGRSARAACGMLLGTLILLSCASMPIETTRTPVATLASPVVAPPADRPTSAPTAMPAAAVTREATPTPPTNPTETAPPRPTALPSATPVVVMPSSAPPISMPPPVPSATTVVALASPVPPTLPAATPVVAVASPLPPVPAAPTAAPVAVAALVTSAGGPLAVPTGAIRLTGRERALYSAAIARGRDGAVFTVAGDSNSEWSGYLGQIATAAYDLRARPSFAAAAARFAPSFSRRSVAVAGGLRAADMFPTDWPDKPTACERLEGRFACELRLSRAAIVFIQLGTGDRFVWTEYEGHVRRMLDVALQSGVLPVLVTKADDLESWQGGAPIDHMNTVVRRLAAEYQLPLVDFFLATRGLPVVPNPQLPDRPFTKNGLLDEWGYYFHLSDLGKEMRILTTLAMLSAIAN